MWELISQQFCLCGGLCGEQQQKTKPLSWCLRISLYICVYSADSCSAAIYLWLHSITSSSSSVCVEVSETFSLLLLVLPAETNINTIWHLYSHNAALNCIKVKSLTSSHIMRPGLARGSWVWHVCILRVVLELRSCGHSNLEGEKNELRTVSTRLKAAP